MTRFTALALASLSLLSLSSCFESTYHVAESEVFLRYMPETDELLVLEIEHGIEEGGKSPEPMRAAADALRGIAEGKRVFPASGEWVATDFDELLLKKKEMTDQEQVDFVAFCDSVHVLERGLYLEEEDRLSLFRLTRLDHFRHMLELASVAFNRKAREPSATAIPFEPDFPIFDEETWNLFRSAVEANHKWLSTSRSAIVLDIPMSSGNAARCLGWIAGEGRGQMDTSGGVRLFEQASGLEVADGHARLRFGDEPKQVLRFTYHSKRSDSSEALIALFKDEGVKLGGSTAPEAALTKLRAPLAGERPPK